MNDANLQFYEIIHIDNYFLPFTGQRDSKCQVIVRQGFVAIAMVYFIRLLANFPTRFLLQSQFLLREIDAIVVDIADW